jgi:hypothetical protein
MNVIRRMPLTLKALIHSISLFTFTILIAAEGSHSSWATGAIYGAIAGGALFVALMLRMWARRSELFHIEPTGPAADRTR